jgi:PRTRC genetic system protein E
VLIHPLFCRANATLKGRIRMFVELLPLLTDRTSLFLTISPIEGSDKIRVCVEPKQFELKHLNLGFDKDAEAVKQQIESASKVLNEAVKVTGTAAELDATLPEALIKYAAQMVEFHTNINEVIARFEEAKKALDEAKKNKTASKGAAAKPAAEVKKPAVEAKSEPPSLGLFDLPPAETSTETATVTPEVAPEANVADEVLPLAAVSSNDADSDESEDFQYESASSEVA